jgi:hypothetical protein
LQLQLVVEFELLSKLDERAEFGLEISEVEFVVNVFDLGVGARY